MAGGRIAAPSPLPGFGLTFGFTTFFLSAVILLPLAAMVIRALGIPPAQLFEMLVDERAVASYRLSFGAAALAAAINAVFGFIVAWSLVRYDFPGRRLLDTMIDLPFALPTAVSGIALATVFSPTGWLGLKLAQAGIQVAYTWLGVVVALVLIGLPFVVRSVQPALIEVRQDLEDAAESLGAGGFHVFRRIILPTVLPALATGFTLAFARGIGEYGSVVFISGNLPLKTEITPLLIVIKLEQYDYDGAAALGFFMLAMSFVMLFAINLVQGWGQRRHGHRGGTLMAAGASVATEVRPLTRGARAARVALIALSVGFLGLLLLAPLGAVLVQALAKGFGEWFASLKDPDTIASIKLTLLTAAIVVPVNTVFGICAAWAIARFEFRGKSLLVTLIDLPFAVSPVIAGLVLVFLFGTQGWFGEWLLDRDVQVIFAVPGIVLATIFISFPYVARELIPLMQQQGSDEEVAALSLGARPWTTFVRITLPKIRWGLLYGVILCNARVMGEFGAVSVVSGHIRGLTNTMPLQVEILYNEYNFVAAFAVASLLAMLAILTLVAKTLVEWRSGTGGH